MVVERCEFELATEKYFGLPDTVHETDIIPNVDFGVLCDFAQTVKNQNADNCEKSRLEGVLLGLSFAKKVFDEGYSKEEILENEVYYREELKKLLNLNTPSV